MELNTTHGLATLQWTWRGRCKHLMEHGRAAKDGFVRVCSLPVQAYNTKGESKWIREAKKISCIDGFKREKIIG